MRPARRRRTAVTAVCAAAGAMLALVPGRAHDRDGDWPAYGRDPGGTRFAVLRQIHAGNVGELRRAWTFHTGDVHDDPRPSVRPAAFETTPIAVDGRLYLSTPSGRVIALEGDTGREMWRFAPEPRTPGLPLRRAAHRGVSYWEGTVGTVRARRIVYGTPDGRLIALDAESGRLIPGFGRDGVVDLREGVAEAWPKAELGASSPPAIYRDLVITGSLVQEFPAKGPSGDVRAYDVRTGALVWRFHTVPRPGEPGHQTWPGESWKDRSGVNVWSVMSLDVERGLLFLPVGSATYD